MIIRQFSSNKCLYQFTYLTVVFQLVDVVEYSVLTVFIDCPLLNLLRSLVFFVHCFTSELTSRCKVLFEVVTIGENYDIWDNNHL